jgi:hypothetical protein
MKRRITIIAVLAALLVGLMYLAHTTDFFGLVQRIHGR